ncbi:Polyphosphate kinase [Gammaproteobacteria bacterium]
MNDSTSNPIAASSPLAGSTIDLSIPEFYLNRELTWLSFNRRVLHEAQDSRTPLLERLKFVAIVAANLDEFFMKRIGGLKQQIEAKVCMPSPDGRTPVQQLAECQRMVRDLEATKHGAMIEVLHLLEQHGIFIRRYIDLDDATKAGLREHYINNIFPLVTPLAMDPAHPFPFVSNLALNLLVTLRFPGDSETYLARVKVPIRSGIAPRFLQVGDSHTYVTLEDVMINNLDLLFPGMKVHACEMFRITRNANVERDEEEADDLLEMIESELRDRQFAPIVRLEVMQGIGAIHRGMLAAELGLNEVNEVYEVAGMMAPRDLMQLAALERPGLRDVVHHPIDNPRLQDPRSIFYIIRDGGPILLQHPYESFATSVERFLRTAAEDPKVLAIKMTLYRTSADSRIIAYLINASRKGKQVSVLVEVKARFDEAANIQWVRRLEMEGIHVTYGVIGLKTHTKVILVVRKDFDRLRRYVHIGTGNYHAGTARLYTDFGMLTCDTAIGQDISELFNFLTGYSPPRSYRKLLVAPYTLKNSLLGRIEREIKLHRSDNHGCIQFKMNALEDQDIVAALYRASQAGVKIDLIVRDTCRLRPGVPGVSENIRVQSIVGRFLEHSRIFYFRNGGDEEYYIGSADCMKRNLESRVEVVAPVEDKRLREDLRLVLDIQLNDRRNAWDMQPDGSYLQRTMGEEESLGTQEQLIELANNRSKAVAKRKRKKFRSKMLHRFLGEGI